MKKLKHSVISVIVFAVMCFSACAEAAATSSSGAEKMSNIKINVTVKGVTKTATLADNASVRALLELLKKGNVTVHTDDYGGFEKVGTWGGSLLQNNKQLSTKPGDIVLYTGNNICFFYNSSSWSYTLLAKLDITDVQEIRTFLNAGGGATDIVLSMN